MQDHRFAHSEGALKVIALVARHSVKALGCMWTFADCAAKADRAVTRDFDRGLFGR